MLETDRAFVESRVVVNGPDALGADIARHFATAGANVVFAGPTTVDLPAPVQVVPTDLSTQVGVNAFAERALELLGDVDVIINCASIQRTASSFFEMTDEDVRRDINTRFMSAVRLDRALIPTMIGRGGGLLST